MKQCFENRTGGEQERPKFVYLSSHNADIEEFVPRRERVRDANEGPVIFATPDKALASVFLVEGHNNSWMQIGYLYGILMAIICADREDFIRKDKGGTVYVLPCDTFNYDLNRGMREKECTSRVPVKPVDKIKYDSALDAMVENAVQVFFVNRRRFQEIKEASDYGASILITQSSENDLRGMNVLSLRKAMKG